MKYEEFFDKYKPIKNPITEGSSFDECMFETYGEDLEYLKNKANENKINDKNGYHIWTVVDGEGVGLYIINGWHIVNRLGYLFTEKPWKEGQEIEIEA